MKRPADRRRSPLACRAWVRSSFMAIRDPLALTEDQRALRDTVRDFLADQLPSAALRGTLDTDPGYSRELHARLAAELGLTRLTVPREFGGLGLGPAEACVMHTELGRVLYPGPILASSTAAAALLAAGDRAAASDRAAARHWLPLLAAGSATGTIAAADQDGRWSSGRGPVRAHLTPRGWRLYGRCWYVIAARVAGVVVVSALAGSVPAMFLVEAGAPGLRSSVQPGLDLTRRVCVTGFEATPAILLSQGEDAAAVLDRVERDFLLATAAEAVGGIGWCLDAAVVYAGDPERPAGSLRGVAHVCVEMLAAFQAAEPAVRYAAVAAADDAAEALNAARAAALQAGQAYRDVTEAAIRLFGGMGSTRKHDAYLYYRRAWSAERLSGGPQAHRAALAAAAAHDQPPRRSGPGAQRPPRLPDPRQPADSAPPGQALWPAQPGAPGPGP
jgi:alkylation response protein AidB-like acyl-CoA dehydrogenase